MNTVTLQVQWTKHVLSLETANKLPGNCKKAFPQQFSLAVCLNQPLICFYTEHRLKFLQLQKMGMVLDTRLRLKHVPGSLARASGCYLKGLACIRLAFSSATLFSASSEPGDS